MVTYDLNRLQGLTTPEQYCVTLNPNGGIDERRVLRRFVYRHPLYTREAVGAQQQWREVSGVNRTHPLRSPFSWIYCSPMASSKAKSGGSYASSGRT
jgi:predicted NAD/FAD-binding protein